MSTMKEKMHTGELYLPGDEEIIKEQVVYQDLLCEYNQTKPSESEKRAALLKRMLGDYTMFGPNVTIATAGHPIL